MKHNAKLTNIQIGQIFIILGLWISLITLLIGFLAKTKYMIYVYGTGLFFSGIFQFFTGLSESYSSLIIFRLFHTLGDAVCTLSLGIIISNVFHVNRLGFSFGFYLISQLIAAIPFSYISGIISFDNNYAIPFYFNGIFMTVCSLMIIIFRNRIKKIFET
jgi:MFS family permease